MKRKGRVLDVRQEPEIALAVADARIQWVLDHPHISDWLKHALRTAHGLDPIALQNDVEMLKHLIMQRSQARLGIALSTACLV
ncbi:hypothetical protein SPAN111604_14250 [Sphingomonas antarctica]